MTETQTSHPDAPIVPPHDQLLYRLMWATALALEGTFDGEFRTVAGGPRLSILAPQSNVLIAATLEKGPDLLGQVIEACADSGLNALVVRASLDQCSLSASFEVVRNEIEWHQCDYRLWMGQPSAAPWLVSAIEGAGPVHLRPGGLFFDNETPFVDIADRERGLLRGAEFLSVATLGWF